MVRPQAGRACSRVLSVKELRSILPYFEPYRTALIVGLVCVFLANVFQIAAPYLMKLAIDGLGDASVTSTRIASLAALIVFAALVGGIFRYGMRVLMNGISRRIEVDLRNDFFRHLLRLDAVFFEKTRTGDLMSRATNDTSAVAQIVSNIEKIERGEEPYPVWDWALGY